MEIWDPVMMTVLDRFLNMKDMAEAVNAMVSVPCSTTKPS